MDNLTTQLARYADATLSRVHRRLTRYLDHQTGSSERAHLTIGRAYEAEWKEYACVFVLSTGRTGTQTLAALLGLSPSVVAEHEPPPRLVKASYDAFMDEDEAQWPARWTALVLAARDDHVLYANKQGKVYVETNNRMTHLAPALREAFPESRFIFTHRHPYKVIQSGMRRGAYQGSNRAWNFARIRPRSGEAYAAEWDRLSPVEKEAWRWARINADARAFMDALPEARRFELPATDLFGREQAVYEKLFAFIGVDCPSAREMEPVLGRRMNAQDHFNGSDYTWTDEDREKACPILADVARDLGYEL